MSAWRRGLVALVAVGFLVGLPAHAPVRAQGFACPGFTRPPIAYDQEQLTVGASSVGFTVAKLSSGSNSADAVRVYVETAQIRVRDDGGAPTSSNGDIQEIGATFWVCGASVTSFKAIRTGGVSAVLNSTFYHR